MATDQDHSQQALEAVQRLTKAERQGLLARLARDLETKESVTPLKLSATCAEVSLTAAEIDEARWESWAGPGENQ